MKMFAVIETLAFTPGSRKVLAICETIEGANAIADHLLQAEPDMILNPLSDHDGFTVTTFQTIY